MSLFRKREEDTSRQISHSLQVIHHQLLPRLKESNSPGSALSSFFEFNSHFRSVQSVLDPSAPVVPLTMKSTFAKSVLFASFLISGVVSSPHPQQPGKKNPHSKPGLGQSRGLEATVLEPQAMILIPLRFQEVLVRASPHRQALSSLASPAQALPPRHWSQALLALAPPLEPLRSQLLILTIQQYLAMSATATLLPRVMSGVTTRSTPTIQPQSRIRE